jgi:Xaa-Pro dipeptidase
MDEPFASRQIRLLAQAETDGLDGLILYSSAGHSFIEMDSVWYASGFKPLGPSAMVIKSGSDPVLFVTPRWEQLRAQESTTADVRPSSDLFKDVGAQVKKLKLSAGAIGVCGIDKMSRADVAALDAVVGSGWTDFDEAARQVAIIKDEYEHELIRRSAWIAEEGYRHALEEARPGMKVYEFAGRLDVYMRELGADDNFLIVSASEHGHSVHSPDERILAEGDVLLAEISPSYKGAFSQICRSAPIGEPSQELKDSYELLRAAFAKGLEACRPGATMGDVVNAVNGPIADAGFEEYCRQPYMRTRGHGMGIGSPFPITVSADSAIELREGMTFVLHPNQYLPTVGYLLCGDHVVIRKDGSESFSARLAQLDVAGMEIQV